MKTPALRNHATMPEMNRLPRWSSSVGCPEQSRYGPAWMQTQCTARLATRSETYFQQHLDLEAIGLFHRGA
jgi:hypothetical protein